MNKDHLVTLTITGEEFDRFRGDESKIIASEQQCNSLALENKSLVDKLRKIELINENLKSSIEVLEGGKEYVKLPNKWFTYEDYCGSEWDYQTSKGYYYTDQYITFELKNSLEQKMKEYKEKTSKIPKWVRKIFGAE